MLDLACHIVRTRTRQYPLIRLILHILLSVLESNFLIMPLGVASRVLQALRIKLRFGCALSHDKTILLIAVYL